LRLCFGMRLMRPDDRLILLQAAGDLGINTLRQ
jgi:hypothetical protein